MKIRKFTLKKRRAGGKPSTRVTARGTRRVEFSVTKKMTMKKKKRTTKTTKTKNGKRKTNKSKKRKTKNGDQEIEKRRKKDTYKPKRKKRKNEKRASSNQKQQPKMTFPSLCAPRLRFSVGPAFIRR